MILPSDYAAPKQEQEAIEYIWEQKGCVQQRREEIVRCRDCVYFATDKLGDYCTLFDFEDVKSMGNKFCAWGERKNGTWTSGRANLIGH